MLEIVQERPSVELSFSSLSVSPTDYSVHSLRPDHTTREMAVRMEALRDRLLPDADASISLHLGYLTNVSLAGEILGEKDVRITSLDRPDVYPGDLVFKDFLRGVREMRYRDALVTLGRRAHNVGSERRALEKVEEGAEVIGQQPHFGGEPVILRTQSALWAENGGKMGDALRESLRGTGIVLAVEINGLIQTQAEYRALIERLAEENDTDTVVYYDLDLGHIAESAYVHREESEGKPAAAFYEDVLAESGNLVAVTSLNQYSNGDNVTHKNFLNPQGSVQFAEVGRILGEAVRDRRVKNHPLTVVEFMPFEYRQFLDAQGTIFVREFMTSFEKAAGTSNNGNMYKNGVQENADHVLVELQ